MRNLVLSIALLGSLSGIAHAAADEGVPVDRIVAVVNDDVVLKSELDKEEVKIHALFMQRKMDLPPENEFRHQVLERLILKHLQLQYAKDKGVAVSDEQLNSTISALAKHNGMTLDQLPKELAKQGMTFQEYRDQLREEMLFKAVYDKVISENVTVSRREVDEYMSQHANSNEDSEFHIAHILVALPGEATPAQVSAAQTKIEKIRKDLLDGAKFADEAARYSDGQQALDGGDLGWRKADELPSIFSGVVGKMKDGEISEPIRSGSGFHLIKLVESKRPDRVVAQETHARHILLKTTKLFTVADAKKKLAAIKARIEAGEDFATLAKQYSEDAVSAVDGGDLGWQAPGAFDPEFEKVLDSLKPGEISDPFVTRFGVHIAQLLDRRDKDFTDQVKENKAYMAVKDRKSQEYFPIWLQQQRDEAYVNILLDEQ